MENKLYFLFSFFLGIFISFLAYFAINTKIENTEIKEIGTIHKSGIETFIYKFDDCFIFYHIDDYGYSETYVEVDCK